MRFDYKKLQQARREKKLSVYKSARELSKYGLDISHQTIHNWESGEYKPNAQELAEIAMFYHKPLLYFFAKENV